MPADHGTPNTGDERSLTAKIADELRRNDECGTGPLSDDEYMDDAAAILRIVAEHRSPQGEDHEAAIEAAMRAFDDAAMGGFDSLRDEDWPEHAMRQAIDAYLARASPSRDGTVAVEDVAEALREARDTLGDLHVVVEGPNAGWVGGIDGYYDDDDVPAPDCRVCAVQKKIDAILAEFGVSERTERIHDQATKEEGR